MPNVPTGESLASLLTDARQRTLSLVSDLSDDQWMGPHLDIVNPMRWEVGHIGWFQEYWVLRHLRGESPKREGVDALYDSARVAHDTRWTLPLFSRPETLNYARDVLSSVTDRLTSKPPSDADAYFHLLALFHEDMHDEAFFYTRQTLAYPRPPLPPAPHRQGERPPGDAEVPGGRYLLGAVSKASPLPFVFDNEKWAHPVEVRPFAIAKTPVTQAEFAAFVDDGGYRRRDWWTEGGWRWRETARADAPGYWRREAPGRWFRREFDGEVPLEPDLPVIHVNAFEAEAFCAWARRRLPTEAEWELAASGFEKRPYPWGDSAPTPERANLDSDRRVPVGACPSGDSPFGCRQMLGNVWEWTSTPFRPYPGFERDPYKEYSEPWFETHRVLRGGCFFTRSRLLRNTWRNFYTPDRRDVLSGFRTCALDAR